MLSAAKHLAVREARCFTPLRNAPFSMTGLGLALETELASSLRYIRIVSRE